jgi:TonB family protein
VDLPDLGLSFIPAIAALTEATVLCRFDARPSDQAVEYAAAQFKILAPHVTRPARRTLGDWARKAPVILPLVVAVHLLAVWLSSTEPAPSTPAPQKQTVVIHSGLAADPAIAAAAKANSAAKVAEAQRQQAAERQAQAAQAAKQQALLEASHLTEQARLQARQKAAPRPQTKPAPEHKASSPAQPPASEVQQPDAVTATTQTAQPAASSAATSSATTDLPASAGKQYVPLVKAAPDYPQAALENEIEGDCTVEYDLLPNGTTTAARLVKGQCDASHFGATSLKAAAGFRYSPQEANGHPVKVIGVRNTFHYQLKSAR